MWIRKNDEFKNAVLAELNAYEIELRADPDFDEVFDEDLGALVDFRKSGMFGEFVVADVDSNAVIRTAVTHTRSDKNSMKPRTSMGSSVSSIRSKISTQSTLDSIREGKGGGAPDTTARKHQQRELSQASSGKSPAVQEEASSSTPSPPKRRRMISSAHSGASISTLGLSRDEEGGNDSNDDDDDTRSSIPSRTKRRRTVSSPASKSTIDGDLKSDLDDTGDEDDKEETSYN